MPKFFRRGVSDIVLAPAVANVAAPTRAEITAGVDLSEALADITGFDFSGSRIPTPNLASRFTPQIAGEDTVGDATLTFYDDDTSTTVRAAVAKGTVGYLIFMPYGDTPTKRAEVWHVETMAVGDIYTMGNDAARFSVGIGVLDPPEQDAVIPA